MKTVSYKGLWVTGAARNSRRLLQKSFPLRPSPYGAFASRRLIIGEASEPQMTTYTAEAQKANSLINKHHFCNRNFASIIFLEKQALRGGS